jgi:hypothetical protein
MPQGFDRQILGVRRKLERELTEQGMLFHCKFVLSIPSALGTHRVPL